jgi:D-aminopeptidase
MGFPSKPRFFRARPARLVLALVVGLAVAAPALARSPVPVGAFPSGPIDGITDVPGVRVANLTKIEGEGTLVPGHGPVRTGATAILPNDDPWMRHVSAAAFALNGNGEMTGAQWMDQAGWLETPVVLTDTLDIGRAYDGTVSWMIAKHPTIGVRDGVPLPVVAECDDQGLNDIQGRHVTADDVVKLLDAARPGDFARGSVGAGTGMHAFEYKGGIGSASRVLPKALGGYTVGVLVNVNFGSPGEFVVGGVPVGKLLREKIPARSRTRQRADQGGRDGSIIIVIATDAPLDAQRLRDIAKRATIGYARAGGISHTSSGDLFLAFSTTRVFPHDGGVQTIAVGGPQIETDDDRIDALFAATADATESAIDDAVFSATDVTGKNGLTLHALPYALVKPLLPQAF